MLDGPNDSKHFFGFFLGGGTSTKGWGRQRSRLCRGLRGAVVLILRPCVCGMECGDVSAV